MDCRHVTAHRLWWSVSHDSIQRLRISYCHLAYKSKVPIPATSPLQQLVRRTEKEMSTSAMELVSLHPDLNIRLRINCPWMIFSLISDFTIRRKLRFSSSDKII